MNEITAVEEQRNALAEQCNLEIPMTIQIKKSFGGTQMVAIRMSVNSVRLAPQISKQMDKVFQVHEVWSSDEKLQRSRRIYEMQRKREQLRCEPEIGDDHTTGGFENPVFKKA